MASHELTHIDISIGTWYRSGPHLFSFGLLIDRLSLSFAGLTAVLCGITTAFSHSYLHREPGYNRFFVLVALFAAGLQLIILGDGLQMAIIGWECVGLSSTLLIGFFHDRPAPIRSAFHTFVVYHATDIGLLLAAALLFHTYGTAKYAAFVGTTWPAATVPVTEGTATVIVLLVLISVAGKSALVPFSSWLPRAMEGPTPSSAIFYGALSVHTGAYLLLRFAPILDATSAAAAMIVVLGLVTAVHATLVGRVQTDIKSSLCYATLTQVGLIVAEIGLGFRWLALFHITGHACIRSLQFLRTPSLLHDHRRITNDAGPESKQTGRHLENLFPKAIQKWLYRYALQRGELDGWLAAFLVNPINAIMGRIEMIDRRWCEWIGGSRHQATEQNPRREHDV
jgi:NADH-quinone oxidoreductase subunit L